MDCTEYEIEIWDERLDKNTKEGKGIGRKKTSITLIIKDSVSNAVCNPLQI